jgi:hypothetical protein
MLTKRIHAALIAAMLLALLAGAASAQPNAGNGKGLEGTWEVTVNLTNPPTGFPPSFKALETYSRGGGMVTSNNMSNIPPGQGSWEKNGNRFTVTILFFTFDAGGAQTGSIKVRHNVRLNGQNNYTGAGTAEFRDASDQILFTVPFTSEGRYLAPEAP